MAPIKPVPPSPVSWLPRAVAAPTPVTLPSWLAPQSPSRTPPRSSVFPSVPSSRGAEFGPPVAHHEARDAHSGDASREHLVPDDVTSAEADAMSASDAAMRAENAALLEESAVLREELDGLRAECDSLRSDNMALTTRVEDLEASLTTTRAAVLEASEPELLQLALAIAERVIGRELATSPALVAEWAHEALACLSAREGVTVTVSPDVAATVTNEAWSAVGVTSPVQVDAALPAVSCVARSGASSADASLAARMSAVRDALDGGEQ